MAPGALPVPPPWGTATVPETHTSFPSSLLPMWETPFLPPRKPDSFLQHLVYVLSLSSVRRAWTFQETLCSYLFVLFIFCSCPITFLLFISRLQICLKEGRHGEGSRKHKNQREPKNAYPAFYFNQNLSMACKGEEKSNSSKHSGST